MLLAHFVGDACSIANPDRIERGSGLLKRFLDHLGNLERIPVI
jgi:hypothetical protein